MQSVRERSVYFFLLCLLAFIVILWWWCGPCPGGIVVALCAVKW